MAAILWVRNRTSIVPIAAEPGYVAAADRQWQHAANSTSVAPHGRAAPSAISAMSLRPRLQAVLGDGARAVVRLRGHGRDLACSNSWQLSYPPAIGTNPDPCERCTPFRAARMLVANTP